MKVTLYLMTFKGYQVLKSIVKTDYTRLISKVIVGRDKNIDYDYSDEIIDVCKNNNIKYFERLSGFEINSPYSLAVSWRWLINVENSRLIILHDSLLPAYRGFAPLVNALIKTEKEVGVTAIFASEEYDTGDIIAQESLKIIYPIKISQVIDLITEKYIVLVNKILEMIDIGLEIHATQQDQSLVSFSLWRDDNDYLIDWNKSSTEILNFINAVSSPYMGASTFINGLEKIRIFDSEIVEDVKIENRDFGKIIFIHDKYPVIVCGEGLLKIKEAIYDKTKGSILPLKKFRVRFTGPGSGNKS